MGFALFGGYDGILERFGPFRGRSVSAGKGLGKDPPLPHAGGDAREEGHTAPGFVDRGGDCGGPTLPQGRL